MVGMVHNANPTPTQQQIAATDAEKPTTALVLLAPTAPPTQRQPNGQRKDPESSALEVYEAFRGWQPSYHRTASKGSLAPIRAAIRDRPEDITESARAAALIALISWAQYPLPGCLPVHGHGNTDQSSASMSVWDASQPMTSEPSAARMSMWALMRSTVSMFGVVSGIAAVSSATT